MEASPSVEPVERLCERLDRTLQFADLRPDDPAIAGLLFRPLQTAVADLATIPRVSDSIPGKVADAIWARLHPENAPMDMLLVYAADDSGVVRLAALEALRATMFENQTWQETRFIAQAREVLDSLREREESPTLIYLIKSLSMAVAKLLRPSRQPRPRIRVNPYVAGVPIKERQKFFGRQDVLGEIERKLGKVQGIKSFILFGARRSGKTSVLMRIQDGALGRSFIPVYIDMQAFAGVPPNTFLGSMARSVQSALAEHGLELEPPPLPSTESSEFRVRFQELMKTLLATAHQELVILIDEYEVLLEYTKNDPAVALHLQHLVESQPNLFFIFAGSHTIESLAKQTSIPLLDTAVYLKITFLSRESALDLVKNPAEGLLSYETGVPERIVDLTAGHPFYTQLFCQSLFDTASLKGSTVVTLNDVEEGVAKFMRDPSPHLILTWNALSHDEKVAGSTLAATTIEGTVASIAQIITRLEEESYPSPPGSPTVREGLTALCELGLVREISPSGSYRFTMELVRRWVEANRSVASLRDEQRQRLLQSVSSPFRLWGAEIIDAMVSLVAVLMSIGIAQAVRERSSNTSGWLEGILVSISMVFYFIVPMLIGRFTVGFRLFKLHPLGTTLRTLSGGRAALYGLLLLVRVAAIAFAVGFLFMLVDDWKQYWIPAGATVALVLADNLLIGLGKLRQGLYERLGRVVLMYRK